MTTNALNATKLLLGFDRFFWFCWISFCNKFQSRINFCCFSKI